MMVKTLRIMKKSSTVAKEQIIFFAEMEVYYDDNQGGAESDELFAKNVELQTVDAVQLGRQGKVLCCLCC